MAWDIPHHWQVEGEGGGTSFTIVKQTAMVAGPDGTITLTKGEASATFPGPLKKKKGAAAPSAGQQSEEGGAAAPATEAAPGAAPGSGAEAPGGG